MGRNLKFLLLILTVLYGTYYWGVPALVKLPQKISFNGYNITMEKPKIKTGIVPSVEIIADSISLLNDDNSKALDIKNPDINIRFSSLRRLNIHYFNADDIEANFVLDKEKKLRLGQYELEKNFPIKLNLASVNIENYNINFDNEILSKKIKITAKTDIKSKTDKSVSANILVKGKEEVKITSDITPINNGIEIKDMNISGKNINAFAYGKITHLDNTIPNLDLKLGVTNSKVEDILPLIPDIPDLSPDIDLLLLKQTGFWGNVSANVELKGKADLPKVYGNVLINNAYMVKPIPNAQKATIKLAFTGDKFDLDVKVPTSPSQTVWVKGPIKLDRDRTSDLEIKSTDSVDLKTAQIVLNPLHDILYFDLGPVPIMDIKGNGGINLHVIGTRKNPHGWGQFYFKNADVSFLDIHNLSITNASGILDFNNQNTLFQSKTAILNGKPITVKGTCSLDGKLDFNVTSNAQDLGKLLTAVRTSPLLVDIQKILTPLEKVSGNANFKLNLYGQVKDINDIVFNKNIFVKGSIDLFSAFVKLAKMPAIKTSGTISFDNLNADLNLQAFVNSSKLKITGKIKDNLCNAQVISNSFNVGDGIKILGLKIPYLNDLSTISTSFIAKYNGKVDNIDLDKLYIKGKVYSNKGAKSAIIVNNSNFELKNSILKLPLINAKLGQMLFYGEGKVTNISKKPNLNIYINMKPSQDFFDQFFNEKSVYPIKVKGDMILTSRISGNLDSINAKSVLDIAENSNLYYMGASIGDVENPVKITLDNTFLPDKIRINNLQYDKIISSQNNKPFVKTQLNASGNLKLLSDNNVGFNNFRIKTQTPTDAKIFNILFRKPFMKQGVFSSDLVLNGTSINPKIQGKLSITSIDIPFYDSTINDINMDFRYDKIFLESKGKILANDVKLEAVVKNSIVPPYVVDKLNIQLVDLDINKISDMFRDIEADSVRNPYKSNNSQSFDISQLIINNAKIKADKIQLKNINANNFTTDLKLDKNKNINAENFKFDIAQGYVLGSLKHNLKTCKTDLDIHLNNANALIMSEALFDLRGQIYGLVNGDFTLACIGSSQKNCFKTLSGSGKFKVSDGKMPKLGSLEYLLKAGNLFKGGITGLSMNSIIDIITPLKTGNFDSISGDMTISNGIANDINVYSSGHDLNMYMTGSYNIVTSVADMQIFGSLSKNITTVFGKIKNASLNTLFNTIPGINSSDEKFLMQSDISKIPNIKNVTDIYRIFAVDINGDINGENYVKSFKWVK